MGVNGVTGLDQATTYYDPTAISKTEETAKEEVSTTGAAKEKDIAVIDFEGFADGKAFEGGKGEKHELELGSHTFIPGFEEQVIGMKKDEEKWEDEGNSIWSYTEIRPVLIQNIINLALIHAFMCENPDVFLEFYDSY